VANRTLLKATVKAYGAYALLALGEGFCEMAIDGGPLMTPKQVLELAETRFTEAIQLATAANNQDILNMALGGRARVRLDLGNYAGAIADARLIPPTYVKNATRDESDTRRYDALCEHVTCATNRHATVAPNYRASPGPACPTRGSGFDPQPARIRQRPDSLLPHEQAHIARLPGRHHVGEGSTPHHRRGVGANEQPGDGTPAHQRDAYGRRHSALRRGLAPRPRTR
jgi:hypothetical protein